jgi:hypothetical protein
MAFLAGDSRVFSLQGIVGIPLMIELKKSAFETVGGMACVALFFELPKVDIFVAPGAVGHQGLVNDGFTVPHGIVAFFTGHRPVFPSERIPSAVMVIDGFPESLYHVTRAAITIELSVVWVFPVTIIASREGHFL